MNRSELKAALEDEDVKNAMFKTSKRVLAEERRRVIDELKEIPIPEDSAQAKAVKSAISQIKKIVKGTG